MLPLRVTFLCNHRIKTSQNLKRLSKELMMLLHSWITESQLSVRCQKKIRSLSLSVVGATVLPVVGRQNVQISFKTMKKYAFSSVCQLLHIQDLLICRMLNTEFYAPKHQLDENKYFMCKYWINANGTHSKSSNKRLNLYDSCVVMDVITQILFTTQNSASFAFGAANVNANAHVHSKGEERKSW